MEKKWFHYLQLCTCSLLIVWGGSQSLLAETASVEVDVEVPVVNGNSAEALEASRKIAFQKALEAVLPAEMEPQLRAQKMRFPERSIHSFQVVEQNSDGQILKVRYRCEVTLPDEAPTRADGTSVGPELQTFEISWAASAKPLSVTDLLSVMDANLSTMPIMMRLGRNFIMLTVPKSVSAFQTKMAEGLGGRYRIQRVTTPAEATPQPGVPQPVMP